MRGVGLLACLWLWCFSACSGEVELTPLEVGPHHFRIALPVGWTVEQSGDSLVLLGADGAEVAVRDFGPAGHAYFLEQIEEAKALFDAESFTASSEHLESLEIRRVFASSRRWQRVGPAWTRALSADDLRLFDRNKVGEAYDEIETALRSAPRTELLPWVRYEFRRFEAEVISLEDVSRDGRPGVRVESRAESPGEGGAPTVAHGFYLNRDRILAMEANPAAVALFPELLESLRFASDS